MTPDSYSLGGVVEELEGQFARLLGKERAIFMPTGTLANHLAVRALASGPSQVIVQEESHLYLDEGDCAQTLSNLTLMPLGQGRATFAAEDVQQLIAGTRGARVLSRVSVISVEMPVRRKQGGVERHGAFAIERVSRGTNLFRLRVRGVDPVTFRQRLAANGVLASAPQNESFLMGVNETLNRTTSADLIGRFADASRG